MEARGGLFFVSLQDEVGSKVCKLQSKYFGGFEV